MTIRLDPSVLDDARARHGFTSDERLAAAVDMSGTAIRNLRHGRSSPSVETLVRLRRLTGRPLDELVIETDETPAA